MRTREPGWELYRTFLEVVRDGSLSGAARKLARIGGSTSHPIISLAATRTVPRSALAPPEAVRRNAAEAAAMVSA